MFLTLIRNNRIVLLILPLVAILYIWSWIGVEFDPIGMVRGFDVLADFLERAYPPDVSVAPTLLQSMIETIQITLLGTTFGAIIAFPLAFLSAKNVSPTVTVVVFRAIMSGVRTIPSLLWAILFVAFVGLGPMAGVLAITLYSIGMLGKLYYEAIESVDKGPVESVASTGASKTQTLMYGVIPLFIPHFIAHTLYGLEYNIRHAALLGLVGAGGIGFYLIMYMRMFEYDKMAMGLLLLLAVVLLIDWGSAKIRSRII